MHRMGPGHAGSRLSSREVHGLSTSCEGQVSPVSPQRACQTAARALPSAGLYKAGYQPLDRLQQALNGKLWQSAHSLPALACPAGEPESALEHQLHPFQQPLPSLVAGRARVLRLLADPLMQAALGALECSNRKVLQKLPPVQHEGSAEVHHRWPVEAGTWR